jgi:tripartite-type tricarboxylate transporter receptor subunit TctC
MRDRSFPDLPTIGEVYPGYEVMIWQGLFTTAGVPAPIIERLRSEVAAALMEPDVLRRLEAGGGLEPFITTPEQFAALIAADSAKYRALIQAIGLRAE